MENCELCDLNFSSRKGLQSHLRRSHQFSIKDLQQYYNSYFKAPSEGLDPFTGGPTKFISLTNGYAKFDGSSESNKKKRATSTLEYWTKVKGYSEEEAKAYLDEKHSTSAIKANKTKKKLMDKNPDRRFLGGYGVKKFMMMGHDEEEAKALHADAKRRRAKNWHDMYQKNPDLFNGKRTGQLEYWMAKGFNRDEAKLRVKESQTTFSLDKCIEKYGKEKGQQVFQQRQKKWLASLHENFIQEGDGRSPSSQFANSIIQAICGRLQIQVPTKEKYIRDGSTGMAYSYDFTLKQKRKIIEFNGDYWHCNPKLYEADYFNKNKQMTAQEIWDYDQVKIELAEQKGYQVLTIWESEWNDDPSRTVERCIQFLND